MVRTSLSRLGSKFCAKKIASTDILEKTNTGTGACLDMSQFRRPWQGPHFPVLWPRLGRKHLSPHPFSTRKAPAPKFVWTCKIFPIMVRTSLARRVSKACAKRFASTSIVEKNNTGPGACLDMLQFLRPWLGPHFLVLCPRLGRKHLCPHPFSKTKIQAPKLAWTCEPFLANGHDLTFSSCGPNGRGFRL